MEFMTVASQMLSLLIIMAVGYIMYKAKIIDDAATEHFSKMVLNISLPAQIISSFIENQGIVSNREILSLFGVSILSFMIYFVLAVLFVLLFHVEESQRGMYIFMNMFANVGFMGYPLITTIYGDSAMIYAVVFNVVFSVVMYSFGIFLIGMGKGEFHFQPKLLLNTTFVSSILSILLFFARIQLPEVVMTSLDYMGNLTTPVAMLILGAAIAAMPIRELFDEWRVYIFTAFRLLVIPLAMMGFFKLCPAGFDRMAGVIVVLSAMPVATNCTMLAIEYGGDTHLAAKGIFFSTILSVVTIPMIAVLFG